MNLLRGRRVGEGVEIAEGERTAEIVLTESIGAEVWVELNWAGRTLRATAPADFAGAPGERVGLTIDSNKVHLFDPETGKRID